MIMLCQPDKGLCVLVLWGLMEKSFASGRRVGFLQRNQREACATSLLECDSCCSSNGVGVRCRLLFGSTSASSCLILLV